MKVITSITLLTKDAEGQDTYLAPGKHDLPTKIAQDAIDRGFAVEEGKEAVVVSDSSPPAGSILDGTKDEIVPQLGDLTAAQLDELAELEAAGKNRKGVLEAIEAAKEDLED